MKQPTRLKQPATPSTLKEPAASGNQPPVPHYRKPSGKFAPKKK
jgi:hypothetical protein